MGAVFAAPTMERMKTFACAFGHTHAPIIYYQKASGGQVIARLFSEGVLALPSPRGRLLLNVGSVGQPRDGDPRACAAIYDQEQRSIEMLRVPYDIRATRRRILQVGLPAFLGDRLLEGW